MNLTWSKISEDTFLHDAAHVYKKYHQETTVVLQLKPDTKLFSTLSLLISVDGEQRLVVKLLLTKHFPLELEHFPRPVIKEFGYFKV